MTQHERAALRNWVRDAKPKIAFEIGTWKGGGSTWQIANGIRENGSGLLVTCETDKAFYDEANQIYDTPEWRPYVRCLNMASTDVINGMSQSPDNIPDFVLFDGPNIAELTLSDFQLLDPLLKSGSFFACHDWDRVEHNTGKCIVVAEKCTLLRPYLENHQGWKILHRMTQPESVGLILAQKQ